MSVYSEVIVNYCVFFEGGGDRKERKRRDRQKEAEQRRYNAKMTKDELEDLNDFIDDDEFFAENKAAYEKIKKRNLMHINEGLTRKQVTFQTLFKFRAFLVGALFSKNTYATVWQVFLSASH